MAVTISSSVALSLGSNMAVIMDTYSESTAAKTTHVFHSDLALRRKIHQLYASFP